MEFLMSVVNKMSQKRVRPMDYSCFSERVFVVVVVFSFLWFLRSIQKPAVKIHRKQVRESFNNGTKGSPAPHLVSVINRYSRN